MSGAHAPLAPSAAHRWIECPGSIPLCSNVPDVESRFAAEGTFAHNIAAECLGADCDAVHFLGTTDGTFTCDEDMAGYVQEYLDEVRALLIDGATLMVEERVSLEGLIDDCHGTADAIVLSGDGKELDVFDFKYGAGIFVGADDNPQLRIYGLGALLTFADECSSTKTP